MAQELDDGEFWLPSEFLTDDDLLMDFKTHYSNPKAKDDFSYSFGFNSDLSSPVESVMGSTETESEEDDFISGLPHKIAHSTLQDSNSTDYTAKGAKLSGSPQSTLCGFKPGSNQSSPHSASRVSSPPDSKDVIGWDLLYAAAGEVARMRKAEEVTTPFCSTNLFAPPRKPSPVIVPTKNPTQASGFYPNHAQAEAHLAYLQLQATHFQRMKQHQQQQMMKSGVWGQAKMDYQFQSGKMTGEVGRTQGALSMAAWPPLQPAQQQPQQQQPGSGMRAVFLGEAAAKKERTGTGVFLPRRFGTNSTETRKKPGCSTVLLPDKVVHALNLNLDSIDTQPQPPRCNRNLIPEYDASLKQRNIAQMGQQRRVQIPQPVMNQELRLPQEWTY